MNPLHRLHPLPLALALAGSCLAPRVQADDAAPPSDAPIEEVVVTAARAREALGDTLAPVTVITRADLVRLQAQDVQELFLGLPGLQIASNGGPGKSTNLYVRGTEPDHVLVLIDGIRIGSATSGSASFEQLPLDQIERIEIVRGPRSSLYGSEAIGGVIQIFTRRAPPRGLVPTFSAGSGTRGDERYEAGLRGALGGAFFGIGLSARNSDGINVRPSQNQPDRDGYRNVAGSARAGFRFDGGSEIAASYLQTDSQNEFDATAQDETDLRSRVFGVTAALRPLERWQLDLSAGRSHDQSDNFRLGDFVSNFDTRRDTVSMVHDLRLGDTHHLALGADHLRDRIASTTDYAETSRENTGVFTLLRGGHGAHDWAFSGRSDDNEQFGTHRTGNAAYGYRVSRALRFGLSHGTAFKAPTFNELYFPNFGSPSLDPESSRSTELSLGGQVIGVDWLLAGFDTTVDDLIARDAATRTAANIDRARIRGVEAQLGTRWQALRVQTAFTWLRPRNEAGDANDGKLLPRRRERSARLDADWEAPRYTLGMSLFGASDGYDDLANATPLAGYATLGLRAGFKPRPAWLLQLEGRNVLDTHYQTAATYENYGAGFMATVRYTPGGT